MAFLTSTYDSPQEAYVAAMAAPLVIAGYPLIESIRTCRVQTAAGGTARYGRAPLGKLGLSDHRWTHEDRDIVTPANDFLYFCAWINLAAAPAQITVPPATGRYFVAELLDAWTENFINLGMRNVPAAGARFALFGPSTPARECGGASRVDCPTDLVWLIGRVLVTDESDVAAARAFMQCFVLDSPVAAAPRAVVEWQDSGEPALDFFANLLRAVADFPPPRYATAGGPDFDSQVRAIGLDPDNAESVAGANARVRAGLAAAHRDAMRIIEAHTASQGRKAWGYSTRMGKWNGNLLLRATAAMKGLGALSADETIYAMADFDQRAEPLDGGHRYVLRFAAGGLPPVDAFWSVSMYGADRFFVDNPIRRYSVGDRTTALVPDADGGLTIPIQHERPRRLEQNWLPAPPGPFYLILRLYHPQPEFLQGRYAIPPVTRID